MGLYLNPSNELFLEDLNSQIYVDKSMLISRMDRLIGTSDKYVCISRPRRFGKSMAGNMISAYYSRGCDSSEQFHRLKIASDPAFGKRMNKLNVIKIDLNGFYCICRDLSNLIIDIEATVIREFIEQFPSVGVDANDAMATAMAKVYAATGEQFVVIIDEYDILVRETVPEAVLNDYLKFLNALFKNGTVAPAIALAYLTGILPVVRDKIQSKLNLFTEHSMVGASPLTEFVGFTAQETEALCKEHGMDYEECRRWYDGYCLDNLKEIFSPRSVVTAMNKGRFGDYWTQTGSFEALKNYILLNFNGIKDDVVKMIGGGKVDVEVASYLNTMTDFHSKDNVFTYLIHLGYLAYDMDNEQCYIPNEEIRRQWVISIKQEEDYAPVMEMINASKQLLEDTINSDAGAVAAALDKAHIRATNPLTYNSESSFQSAIGLAYFYANTKYTVIKELPTGKGYADLALIPYLPDIPAMIIELKNGKTAEGALKQIKDRKYDDLLEHYRGDMLLVGVNYDPDTKEHTCLIERYEY